MTPLATRELFAALDACFGGHAPWQGLVDLETLSRARGFKLDVSFSFVKERWARFAINDKGEPHAFRTRLWEKAGELGLSLPILDQLLAISPAGELQTTVGVKWRSGEAPAARVSVYLEELSDSPSGAEIRRGVLALAGAEAPALERHASPNSVCIDFSAGAIVGSKTYDAFLERPGDEAPPLPAVLARVRDDLPFHLVNGTRRTLLARRFDSRGNLVGCKLFWMTELHDESSTHTAWIRFDRLFERFGGDANPFVVLALAELRERCRERGDLLFPDLVGINLDGAGAGNLVVHVSIR